MTDDTNPECLDQIITVTMPRSEYLLLRKFLNNLGTANAMVKWATITIGGVAVVMGIIYSWSAVFGLKFGQGAPPPHGG